MMRYFIATTGLIGAFLVFPAVAQTSIADINKNISQTKQTEQQLAQKAKSLSSNVEELREQILDQANTLQDNQIKLLDIEDELNDLETNHDDLLKKLESNQESMTELVGILSRLSLLPPDALVASPNNPDKTIQSLILLKSIVPNLKIQADTLRQQLDELASLTAQIESKRKESIEQIAKLEKEKTKLESLVTSKSKLLRSVESDRQTAAKRAEALAAESSNLQELMGRLASRPKPAPPVETEAKIEPKAEAPAEKPSFLSRLFSSKSFSGNKGRLLLPVQGKIIHRFGDKTETGGTSRGIYLMPSKSAQVVAPYDGEIVYAGQFRTYGQLLIIDHGEGYHILLTGLSKMEHGVGDSVLAGEPVGISSQSKGKSQPLYVELRHDGKAVDPLAWFKK